ncbi:MAG: M64 family metallopeptidase [Bdellovibrionota bacterium]
MKRLGLIFVACSFMISAPTFATTVVIVTDQPGQVKAKEVISTLKSTPPFSRLQSFDLKIKTASTKTIGCDAAPLAAQKSNFRGVGEEALQYFESIDRLSRLSLGAKGLAAAKIPASCTGNKTKPTRLITCDTPKANRYLGSVKGTMKADFVLVVLNLPQYGGSGGRYPVITAGSPATMMVHEFMHQLGFADEYAYISACEADTYCDVQAEDSKSKSGYGYLPGTSFNVALFNSFNSYIDDEDVRNRHATKIPWVRSIATSTPLQVNGKLGTPAASSEVGIYPAIVCEKASRRLDTWQSVSKSTIMKSLSTNYIPEVYWNTIAKSLGTTIRPASKTK